VPKAQGGVGRAGGNDAPDAAPPASYWLWEVLCHFKAINGRSEGWDTCGR
jgi:hypothetical protein